MKRKKAGISLLEGLFALALLCLLLSGCCRYCGPCAKYPQCTKNPIDMPQTVLTEEP